MTCILNQLQEMGESVLRVLVVGDRGCGKSTFCNSIFDRHSPIGIEVLHGEIKYSSLVEIKNQKRRVDIIDSSGNLEKAKKIVSILPCASSCLVVMFAIDDPESFENLKKNWLDPISSLLKANQKAIYTLLVGNKMDLREKKSVINRLKLRNLTPVTTEQEVLLLVATDPTYLMECSSLNPAQVDKVFDTIFELVMSE